MQKLNSFLSTIWRRPGLVLTIALVFTVPHGEAKAESLKDLDTRADGSRVLNMVVHDEARSVPEVKFLDTEGNPLSLKSFRGKIVAVHFWATWCMPCRDELPTVDAAQNQFGGEDFTFLPLSVDRDGAELVQKYYADNGIQYLPNYIDDGMTAAQALRVNGIPYTILLNREGMEIARILGDRDWSTPDATQLMRRLIE